MEQKIYFKNPAVNIPQLLYEIRKFEETDEAIGKICDLIGKIFDLIEDQEQRISTLIDIIYKIAPELEIIEAMSDTDEQQQRLIDQYMNHGEYLD